MQSFRKIFFILLLLLFQKTSHAQSSVVDDSLRDCIPWTLNFESGIGGVLTNDLNGGPVTLFFGCSVSTDVSLRSIDSSLNNFFFRPRVGIGYQYALLEGAIKLKATQLSYFIFGICFQYILPPEKYIEHNVSFKPKGLFENLYLTGGLGTTIGSLLLELNFRWVVKPSAIFYTYLGGNPWYSENVKTSTHRHALFSLAIGYQF